MHRRRINAPAEPDNRRKALRAPSGARVQDLAQKGQEPHDKAEWAIHDPSAFRAGSQGYCRGESNSQGGSRWTGKAQSVGRSEARTESSMNGAYQIVVPSSAQKAIAQLPKPRQRQVRARIDALANDPRPHGSVKLS